MAKGPQGSSCRSFRFRRLVARLRLRRFSTCALLMNDANHPSPPPSPLGTPTSPLSTSDAHVAFCFVACFSNMESSLPRSFRFLSAQSKKHKDVGAYSSVHGSKKKRAQKYHGTGLIPSCLFPQLISFGLYPFRHLLLFRLAFFPATRPLLACWVELGLP